MAGALPPGAWWEYANTNSAMPIDRQPYGPNAGEGWERAALMSVCEPSCCMTLQQSQVAARWLVCLLHSL